MRHFKVFLIFLTLFYASNAYEFANQSEIKMKNDTLFFATIIFRHGDRTPIRSYPTDPWKDWPEGFGRLTNVGIQQEYDLGLYLRDRYRSLLRNFTYSNDLVYVQSTDVDRTLMSAESVVTAMFPPKGDQIWKDNLLWQPIPIHTIPTDLDYILAGGKKCPRFDRALQNYLTSTEMIALCTKYEQLFKYLEKNSGAPIRTVSQALELYDTLWIEQLKNKTLPEWTKSVFGKGSDFEYVSLQDFKKSTNTTELARLGIGFLIRDIFTRCSRKINGSLLPNRSLWIYSAHDTTIANILNVFGHFDTHNPTYASSLHFDLYKSKEDFYLRVSYRNSSGEMYLEFPHCGTKCSIEDLQKIYVDIIPTDSFENECQLPLYIRVVEGNRICGTDDCIVTLICLGVVVPIVFLISGLFFYRRRGNIKMDTKH